MTLITVPLPNTDAELLYSELISAMQSGTSDGIIKQIESANLTDLPFVIRKFTSAESEQFWALLHSETRAITEIPAQRFDANRLYEPANNKGEVGDNKIVSKWCGTINDVSLFDALFFEVSPKDAANIDPTKKTAWVDMSGDGALTEQLHNHFNENMVESCMVGATHWQAGRSVADLPGAAPTFFFAPAQIAKRDKEWGGGVLYGKAAVASVGLAQGVSNQIAIEQVTGAQNVSDIWKDLVDYRVAPNRGIMASL